MPLGNVYVFHYATGPGYYKIGRTGKKTADRLAKLSGGSPVKPTILRDIETENPPLLENYIHALLGTRRVHKEFFRCSSREKSRGVTEQQLDDAITKALAFMETCGPVLMAADQLRKRLQKQKPPDKSDGMLLPTSENLEIYRQLRRLAKRAFLLEKDIEVLKGKLLTDIGENRGIKGIASWGWTERQVLRVKNLPDEDKKIYEALFDKHKEDGSYRTFKVELDGIF